MISRDSFDTLNRRLSIFVAIAVALLAIFVNRIGLDARITNLFFDAEARLFPLRNEWLWSTALHDGEKWLSIALWTILLLAWFYLAIAKRGSNDQWRDKRSFLSFTLAVSALAVATVNLFKGASLHSCPWHLTLYGGSADFFFLGATLPPHPGPGRCFPSGHVSTGFMWISAIYASHRWLPGLFKVITVAVAFLGVTAGFVQVARGAHFVSHVLVGAAACWAVAWLADCVLDVTTHLRKGGG